MTEVQHARTRPEEPDIGRKSERRISSLRQLQTIKVIYLLLIMRGLN